MTFRRYHRVIALLAAFLAGCSGDQMEQSTEGFSALADVHTDPDVVASTGEIDKLLAAQNATGAWSAKVFDTETVLLQRSEGTPGGTEAYVPTASPGTRRAFFGDLHVHTQYSFDAFAMGTQATPRDAYRFARGEAISNPGGFQMQMSRPLDFYSVTDHGMFLGLALASGDTSTAFSKNAFAEPYHDLNGPDNYGTDFWSISQRLNTFATFLPRAVTGVLKGDIDRDEVSGVIRAAWADIIAAADEFYEPGRLTTFVGYEYTSSTPDMGNLHRNVIFRGSDRLPREPFSRFHSINPEDLWQWMDALREQDVESLAIPHNSNGSNGQMFKLEDWAGNPLDDAYASQRARNEPIVEITQIKGTSETHPLLSTRDEFAGFEIMPYRVATNALSAVQGSYAREALLNGLKLEQTGMSNPFQFGMIGASDTHSGAAQVEEPNFVSKLGLLSSEAAQRGSVPRTGLDGQMFYYGSRLLAKYRPSARGNTPLIKTEAGVYDVGAIPTFGASGLAGVWAEENNRHAIYEAFRRREVFATSGPRIRLRFFAGHQLDASMLASADGVERAYQGGVSMGGELMVSPGAEVDPAFLVLAEADPLSAPLQRLQVIKGWVDASGETHEAVIDVACAGGMPVDPTTQRCPDNGARVDLSDCSINPETGDPQLAVFWRDPNYDPTERAFYYARVIENPTCRWSTWDAIRAGVAPRPDLVSTLQERGWTSPIQVVPTAAEPAF